MRVETISSWRCSRCYWHHCCVTADGDAVFYRVSKAWYVSRKASSTNHQDAGIDKFLSLDTRAELSHAWGGGVTLNNTIVADAQLARLMGEIPTK